MNIPELIRKKRDGEEFTTQDIFEFVEGYTRGEVPDYQASALLMAIYFRGMNDRETADLTASMLRSGRVLDLTAVSASKVDKHSTGGVGDKTTLVIAPAAAAAGLAVPTISGRGLGHSGGTLDKLESIPGFNPHLSYRQFQKKVEKCGLAFGAATDEFAPADKKLYALRDVAGTVESIPLISASIMSKKLAEGIDALVLDVKMGSGALMPELSDARELARRLVAIGVAHGKRMQALITDMSQPLGRAIGNSLEVMECLEVLKGRGPKDLIELCRELTAWMLLLGNSAKSIEEARGCYDSVIARGEALTRLGRVIEEQGGDPRILEDSGLLPQAKYQESVVAQQSGHIERLDARLFGFASMALGAGREHVSGNIDPAVGVVLEKKVGEAVQAGDQICTVHYNDRNRLPRALDMIHKAISISGGPVTIPTLIIERIPEQV